MEYALDVMNSHVLLYKKLTYSVTRFAQQLLRVPIFIYEGTYSVHTSYYLSVYYLKKEKRNCKRYTELPGLRFSEAPYNFCCLYYRNCTCLDFLSK